MTLYLYELKSGWKSLLVWIVCIIGFLVFSMAMFPSFAENAEATEAMLANFSPDMLKALGIDIIDFSKPMDYLSYMYQYLLVAVGAFAVLLGGSSLSKEESDKTIEFLYAKPISRTYIAAGKMAAALTKTLIIAVVFYLSMTAVVKIVAKETDFAAMFSLSLGLLLFMLVFLSLGFVFGHFIIKPGKRLPLGLGTLFLMYFIAIFVDVSGKYDYLKYFTPFKYFSGIDIVYNGFTSEYIIISICVIALASAATGWLYRRKDLAA